MTAQVISFNSIHAKRSRCVFRNRPVFLRFKDGSTVSFPCIALYDQETGIPLMCPAFERFYLNIQEAGSSAGPTLNRKANSVRAFLNFLLWETDCDTISDVTVDILRDFYADFRETDDGDPRDPDGWIRGIKDVAGFLYEYRLHNSKAFDFGYSKEDLYKEDIRNKGALKISTLGVKAPKKTGKKGRFILEGYRDMILAECRMYDPILVLGVALQSSAGLREGEIVNLTRSSISLVYGGFGRLSHIRIDLTDEAPFAKKYSGTSEFGKIKKKRTAEVYPDFIAAVHEIYKEHEKLLTRLGADDSSDAPLFVNRYGKPMSVTTYKGRLKDVFQQHFVPDLWRIMENSGDWAEHAPFAETWTEHTDPKTGRLVPAEYPGAHMFRHWFTMYLLDHTDLSPEEIAKWRGDASSESMQDYVHINARMIRAYKDIVWKFQEDVMTGVLNWE